MDTIIVKKIGYNHKKGVTIFNRIIAQLQNIPKLYLGLMICFISLIFSIFEDLSNYLLILTNIFILILLIFFLSEKTNIDIKNNNNNNNNNDTLDLYKNIRNISIRNIRDIHLFNSEIENLYEEYLVNIDQVDSFDEKKKEFDLLYNKTHKSIIKNISKIVTNSKFLVEDYLYYKYNQKFEISVSIKLLSTPYSNNSSEIDIENLTLTTIFRDIITYEKAERLVNEEQALSLDKNSDFYNILTRKDSNFTSKVFISNDLLKEKNYFNQTENYSKYYDSAVVFPIIHEENEYETQKIYDIDYGFICVDTKKYGTEYQDTKIFNNDIAKILELQAYLLGNIFYESYDMLFSAELETKL
ncbi:MAG: hypothetical protein ACNI3C_10400 [Candidatus Marinarcus sp.]|uniref:hypothetical protein n=1 Tax=Candidatus Marinarcus sp. TaxID=3100987 RepID=UPI003B00C1B0